MLITQFFLSVINFCNLRRRFPGAPWFQWLLTICLLCLLVRIVFVLSTERTSNALTTPIIYYTILCCYPIASAYQLACNCAVRRIVNLLTNGSKTSIALHADSTTLQTTWKTSQRLGNMFRLKWVGEYLLVLADRTKWFHPDSSGLKGKEM